MRLPLIPPTDLDTEQRHLYDDMRQGIEANFKGFTAIDDGGRLIGPSIPGCVSEIRRSGLGIGQVIVHRPEIAASGPRNCDPRDWGTLSFRLCVLRSCARRRIARN